LPDVLAGRAEPSSPTEACEFALLCSQPFQKRYATAVRLFEGAFASDSRSAVANYYFAATAAARAAKGNGLDSPADEADRTALRQKALTWLRADLALRQKHLPSLTPAQRRGHANALFFYLTDPSLSCLRPGPGRIGLLAEERAEWDRFWSEVRSTLADAQKS
jgi:hypothetical protein